MPTAFLLALLFALPAASQDRELACTKEQHLKKDCHAELKTLLILGDSLSTAYNLAPASGWVSLLDARLQQQNLHWQLVNASISGETTAGGLTRLPALLKQHRPQVVILELGGNDGLRGLAVSHIQANLQEMINLSQATGAQVLLLGMLLPPNYGSIYSAGFAAIYTQLAYINSVSFVPFLLQAIADQPELMQDDAIHPTAKAQPYLLETVWLELFPLL